MKKAAIGVLVLAVVGALFYWAWKSGKELNEYPVTRFGKDIPLPLLYETVEGTASWMDGNKVRAQWGKTPLPAESKSGALICKGSFRPVNITYYLLELDGTLYIEKGEFVEPLIFALYNLEKGGDNERRPASIEDVVTLLPDDPKRLMELCKMLKKVELKKE